MPASAPAEAARCAVVAPPAVDDACAAPSYPPSRAALERLLALTADRAVFEDEELLSARMAALAGAVGADAARAMALRSPLLMTSDLERRLPERIAALRLLLSFSIIV